MNTARQYEHNAECAHGIWDDQSVCRLKTAYHRKNIFKRIEDSSCDKSKLRMLEFGPGLGCLIDLVHSCWPDAEYHTADVDPGLLKALSERFPSLRTHQLQGSDELERIEGQFDVIAAADVWEHLLQSEALAYTAWCWQRLAPGGMLILQTPNWGCPVTPATFYSDLTHRTALNEESIRQLFRSAGIPGKATVVLPRKTPGFLGGIRDGLNGLFGLFYRLVFIFFGAVRLRIFSPDLIAIARKPTP